MSDRKPLVKESANGTHLVWCPGCESYHGFDERWQYNGDPLNPTFSPSLLVNWQDGEKRVQKVCHSFVRDGQWQFLNDSTHELAGKTVPMVPIEDV